MADAVVACLKPIGRRYQELRADPGEVERILAAGARKAIDGGEAARSFERLRKASATP